MAKFTPQLLITHTNYINEMVSSWEEDKFQKFIYKNKKYYKNMFDFENLEVYKKSRETNKDVLKFLRENKQIDLYVRDQMKRASISIMLNIAEGSGRISKADKKHFYTISRGSVYECVSLIELICDEKQISKELFNEFYSKLESLSKMLLGLINSQKPNFKK